MLTLFIIICLFIGAYTGVRRGFVLQLVYTFGYLLAFIFAKLFYQDVAIRLELLIPYPMPTLDSKLVFFPKDLLFTLDKAFYAGMAFLLLLFVGWLFIRFLGIFFHKLTYFPVVRQVNLIGGGLLGFIVVYIGLFLLLFVLSLVPVDSIQNLFRQSSFARMMIDYTPVLSKQIYSWWVTAVIP